MATREQNTRKAAFYAGLLEKTITEIEQTYKTEISPLAIGKPSPPI